MYYATAAFRTVRLTQVLKMVRKEIKLCPTTVNGSFTDVERRTALQRDRYISWCLLKGEPAPE